MTKMYAWRLYSDFLRCETKEEAEEVLKRASDYSDNHILRLSYHFAEKYGRLPDEYHNLVILTGGPLAKKYLSGLDGGAKKP